MKTILVPTDFSECANNALEFAAVIAKKTGASLNLLHVLDVLGDKENALFMMAFLKVTKIRMNKILSLPFMKGMNAVHNIEVGTPHLHIIAAAKKFKADMIVMGTHGSSGMHEIFIGSNAERVARNSNIPVISIKDKISNPKIETIIFATDFSEETEFVFPTVKKFAKLFGAKIHIVKVITLLGFEPTYETQKEINRFCNKFKHTDCSVSIYYDHVKQEGIRRFAAIHHADMIALGTHGRQGLAHFFNGSIAEDLVNHSPLPVLTVNIPKREIKSNYPEKQREKNKQSKYFAEQIPAL